MSKTKRVEKPKVKAKRRWTDSIAIKTLPAHEVSYKVVAIAHTPALFRLMQLRHTKLGRRYICIAIGGKSLKEVVDILNAR